MLSSVAGWLGHPALHTLHFTVLAHVRCIAHTLTNPTTIMQSRQAQNTLRWHLTYGNSTQPIKLQSNYAAADGASDMLGGVLDGPEPDGEQLGARRDRILDVAQPASTSSMKAAPPRRAISGCLLKRPIKNQAFFVERFSSI